METEDAFLRTDRNGTNHGDSSVWFCYSNDGRATFWSPCPPHVWRQHEACFIQKDDVSASPVFSVSPRHNGRELLLQPLPQNCWILLHSYLDRFLDGKTPARQESFHLPNLKIHPKASLNQMPHRCSRPKIKRKLQLIRAIIFDDPANHLFMLGVEPAADWTPSPSCPKSALARMLPQRDPAMNRLTCHPKNLGHFRLGAPFFEGGHRLEANRLLSLRSQRTRIASL